MILPTGQGFWNPLMWGLLLIAMLILTLVIRMFGNKKYKQGTRQTEPFVSGLAISEHHIQASNLYWGFTITLKKYYQFLEEIHTGNINDYVFWVVFVLATMLLLAMRGGVSCP